MRKTKIICTLGPAVDSEDMIRTLIRSGMDAARFNFSHGSHPEHLERLSLLKAVRDAMGRPVATILDTKGRRSASATSTPSPFPWRRGIPSL